MDNSDLWIKVITTKRRVIDVIGCNLSHKFRSTHTYQTYTGLCGEAQMEFEDGDLRRDTVDMLVEYADKVIAIWQEEETK